MELRSGKASGVCGIHGEALKAGGEHGYKTIWYIRRTFAGSRIKVVKGVTDF